ncbi:asparaginase [Streptomyces sp. AV19]|nr:asparaginase [Streptomyces sp. AV19]MBH1932771.1 asparaginase [Streptomyces sp. AV19]MDG4531441.1 asparaginase [Streptomyces sp. AV19]
MAGAVRTVAIYSLGGTIAMTTDPDTGGVVPALSAHDLLATVPGLDALGINLRVHDFCRVPGASLTFENLAMLSEAINAMLDEGEVDGVVVTQGTDTIEETAFFLDLCHAHAAPVIVTGAMRNPTMAGPDGPGNLYAAVVAAADPRLRESGCLVVMGDEIHAARHVRKSHTTSPAAFTSPSAGPLGRIAEDRVHLVGRLPDRPAPMKPLAQGARVGLYTVSLGDDGALLGRWDDACDGLVVAAFGVGHVPQQLVDALEQLATRIPVVLASRIGSGPVLTHTYGFAGSETDLIKRGLIPAGSLSPYQARLLLHQLIAHGTGRDAIAATFTTFAN